MKRYLSALALIIVSLALGAAIRKYYQGARHIDFAHEPLWAYGFTTVPAPGDTALPQKPPTRASRRDCRVCVVPMIEVSVKALHPIG